MYLRSLFSASLKPTHMAASKYWNIYAVVKETEIYINVFKKRNFLDNLKKIITSHQKIRYKEKEKIKALIEEP